MKIVTAKLLADEPMGTVYGKFVPNIIGDIAVKVEQRGSNNQSWWATYLNPWFKNEGDIVGEINGESTMVLNKEVEMETICTDDAVYNYNDNELFVVFNNEEVQNMIDVLVSALNQNRRE